MEPLDVTTCSVVVAEDATNFYRRNMSPDKRSSVSIHCRICHEDGGSEELIGPCECAGTVALIHASCLEKWLSTSNTDRCEICKYPFTLQRKNKPLVESLLQWWTSRSSHQPQGLLGDAICLVILTPLCAAATYLCAIGASAYARQGYWEGTGLAVLCCMLVATYCLWFAVTLRFHYRIWQQWRRRNQEVKLLVKHRVDNPVVVRSPEKSPRNRQDSNNNRTHDLSIFNMQLSHHNDPVFTFHQQTSFV